MASFAGYPRGDDRRLEALELVTSVHRALMALRTTTDLDVIFDRGVQLVCEVCGFDRAMMFAIDGSTVRLERLHFPADPAMAAEFSALARAEPPRLTHMLVETEMIRRRAPVLVADARGDPRAHKPFTELAGVRSYVAAPILPEGRVIGFIHADHHDSGRTVDRVDRDVLFAFAEGFGWVVERAILLERLNAQRGEIHRMARSAEALVDRFANAELVLGHAEASELVTLAPAAPMFERGASGPRLGDLLTQRESEVLQLLTEGMTNAAIADRLIISQATVKSHVQRVLRKLGASNRADAVSRYLRMRDGT